MKAALILLSSLLLGLWAYGPREPAKLDIIFKAKTVDADLTSYLSENEKKYTDITPGVQKRIIWADKINNKTTFSIVYIHGFSATSEEIRPVPDLIAKGLGANLYFTRLSGHGRSPIAMAEPSVRDWMIDVAEALEIGRRIGLKIIVISASTGSTLAAAAALNPDFTNSIAGFIFISPNFGINNPLASLLTWPGARLWVPLVVGEMRINKPRNTRHAKYWTTSYPTIATLPMAAIVKAVNNQNFSKVHFPALFYYSVDDQVVNTEATAGFARRWGGAKKTINVTMTNKDDIHSHIIMGDIVSPNQTKRAVEIMTDWIKALPNS